MEYLPIVRQVFPDARYIYTVRDPRGLWNSAQRFKNRNRGDEILDWMLTNDIILERSRLGQNLMTVRYEDLVTKPESTCTELYGFLGCDFSPSYLQYDPRSDPYPDRWDWIPEAREQFNRWHAVKWQEEMEPSEIARVSRLAGEFMVKYRYEY
jgi:hypothetical protein